MNAFLRQMTGLCLAGMLLDMLLPEGDEGKYAGLGLELSLMLCMLQGLETLAGLITP